MEHDSSASLIYKYFVFAWLFHDVNHGNWLERSAAWRYNHAHSHWLLTYLKRWVVLDFSAFAFGALTSLLFQGHWICIPFYVIFSIAIPVISVIVVAWLGSAGCATDMMDKCVRPEASGEPRYSKAIWAN